MDDSGINNYAEAPRQSAGKIWEISAIVFGVALAVGLVLWLIGLVHFGRVKLDESQSYEIVCDADIVNHLNAVGFPGLEGNTREWQRVIDQLSEHSGWDGDPTCAAISFLNSQYNQDIDGMKAALDKIKNHAESRRFFDDRLDGMSPISTLQNTISWMKRNSLFPPDYDTANGAGIEDGE